MMGSVVAHSYKCGPRFVVPHLAREQAGELEGVICVLASSKGKSPLLAYSINTVRHPREYPTAVYMTHTNILHLFSWGFLQYDILA